MQGQQILVSIDIEEFWRQMRVLIEDVLTEKNIISPSSENNSSTPKLLKTKEVCELFQVSKPTIYDWLRQNKIKSFKIKSRRYFLRADIEAMIKQSEHHT